MTTIWKDSMLLMYGSHVSIRIAKKNYHFPILKLVHRNKRFIKLIQYEFDILVSLTKFAAMSVMDVDLQPIMDDGIVYGYRMKEELFGIQPSEWGSLEHNIKLVLSRLHFAGFCYRNIFPNNVMKDNNGQIILIDLAFAGKLGYMVPSFIPDMIYSDGIFDADVDWKALDRWNMLLGKM